MDNNTTEIILASSSLYRNKLLSKLNIKFTAIAPNIKEDPLINEDAIDTATRLARQKAQIVARRYPKAIIISADQVLSFKKKQYGKPKNLEDAKKMLEKFSGKKLIYYCALYILVSKKQKSYQHIAVTEVKLRKLTKPKINKYLKLEPEATRCAGSIKSEGLGMALIERIISDDPNAIIGLPMYKLIEFLNKEKINFI